MSTRPVDPNAIPSRNRALESNSALSQALVGKTIAGLVVGAIEVYADGAIYDNNRFLSPGSFAVDPRGISSQRLELGRDIDR